jgi:hypothetical protein
MTIEANQTGDCIDTGSISYSQNTTGTKTESRVDFNGSLIFTNNGGVALDFEYDLGSSDLGNCSGSTWISGNTGTKYGCSGSCSAEFRAYADCIEDIDCSAGDWTSYYCNATAGEEEIRCTKSNIVNNWSSDLLVNLSVTAPSSSLSTNWGSCYDCSPIATIAATDDSSYTFSDKADTVTLTEGGWILNGSCSEFVNHRQYWNETVLISNVGNIAMSSCSWSVNTPGSNVSVLTSESVDVVSSVDVLAQVYEWCSLAPTLTAIVASPTCFKSGDTVIINSSDAADPESDDLILRVGTSSSVYDLCNSTSGQPERSCSFASPFSDTGLHTIYGIVDEVNLTSGERNITISSDNSGPGTPTNLSPNSTQVNSTNLSWSSVSDIGCSYLYDYNVQIASDSSCSNVLVEANVTETNFTTQLIPGRYYWHVRARDALDNYGSYSNCVYFDLVSYLTITIDNPSENQIIHRGDRIQLNSTVRNTTDITTANVTWYNLTAVIGTGEDINWTVPMNYPLGLGTIYANASKESYYYAQTSVGVLFYGFSDVSISAPSFAYVGEKVRINCTVTDANLSTGIANYPVSFYNGTTLIGQNTTNGNGIAMYEWDSDSIRSGLYELKCRIYDSSSLYYNASISEATAYITMNRTVWVTVTQGNNSRVGVVEGADLTLTFYDPGKRIYPEGVSGRTWINKSGVWQAFDCTSNDLSSCSVRFRADCSYSAGWTGFIGGVYNDDYYNDTNSSYVAIYIDMLPYCERRVKFSLEFNLSENQQAEPIGFQSAGNYACVHDSSMENDPTFGIVFAGSRFDYVNVTSQRIELSQYQSGNRFIIPITKGSCSIVRDKPVNEVLASPFSSFATMGTYPVELILSYPIDIVGDFSRSGAFIMNLEKNETDGKSQIIIGD